VPTHRLLLVRHAQAAEGPADMDRPLTETGALNARAIGDWLAGAHLAPDRVLVSPARRALETWDGTATMVAPKPDPIVEPRVYDNTVDALLTAIGETGEDVRVLAVVGHNPSIGGLARALDDGEGKAAARRDLEAGFPAGAVAVFSLAVPFADLAPGIATLDDFAVPGR
jgi:phosphohistidine phosphatase